MIKADNIEYLPSGAVRGRRGYAKYTSSPLPGGDLAVSGLWRHYGLAGSEETSEGTNDWSNDSGVGTVSWTNPTFANQADQQPAEASLAADEISEYLTGATWGFSSIPDDARILGIAVQVLRCASQSGAGSIQDYEVRLGQQVGLPRGDNQASDSVWRVSENATPESSDYEEVWYGGRSELWGSLWTVARVKDPAFAVYISAQATGGAKDALIDQVYVWVYYSSDEDQKRFLVVRDEPEWENRRISEEYPDTPGAFRHVSNILITDYRPRFIFWPAKNKTFIFDGGLVLYYYNTEAFSVVSASEEGEVSLEPRTGPYACIHNERLWASDPNELNQSVYASAVLDETTWYPENQISVSDGVGGEITGLESYGGVLVILKESGVWAFAGDIENPISLNQISTIGCIAPATVAKTPRGIVFLARDGVYLTDGRDVYPLSDAIRPLFVNRTQDNIYPNAVGIYHRHRQMYYLNLEPATGTECYVMQELRVPTEEGDVLLTPWARISSLPFHAACTWDGPDDDGEIFFGSVDAYIYRGDYLGYYDNSPFRMEIQTPFRALSEDRRLGRAYHVKAHVRALNNTAGGIRYDQAESDNVSFTLDTSKAVPEFQHPRATITDQAEFGRFASVRLSNDVDGYQWEVHGVWLENRMRSIMQWR